MFTARGQCSSFLRELEQDGAVSITDTDGKATAVSLGGRGDGVLAGSTKRGRLLTVGDS